METLKEEKYTILHLFSGDLWAGAEVMIFNLLKALQTYSDLRVIAVSLNEGILTEKLRKEGIETHIIPEGTCSFAAITLKTLKLLKSRSIDLIHAHRYKENLLALLLAWPLGVKRMISTMHGLTEAPLNGHSKAASLGWKGRMDYFLLSHIFSVVVAVSEQMKKVLVEQYDFCKERVAVIHNGIEIPQGLPIGHQHDSSLDRSFRIGTAGRMVPVKDFPLFLEVAAEIKKKVAHARFSILGDGPLKEELIQKARALGLQDCVGFLPPQLDPFPYYRSLDLYLNTSIHEGIPLSVLEAMGCGKPIVAPRVGGITEIISSGEEGWLVKSRKSEQFARACVSLIQNQDLRITMGEKAMKKVAACFGSRKMAESYRRLYQELCTRS